MCVCERKASVCARERKRECDRVRNRKRERKKERQTEIHRELYAERDFVLDCSARLGALTLARSSALLVA